MSVQPSKSFNPFAPLDAGTAVFRDLLTARLAEAEPSPVWRSRASGLATTVAPLLAWVRDTKGVDLDSSKVQPLLQFDTLVAIGDRTPVMVQGLGPCDLTDVPIPTAEGIRSYLAELPGYDPLHRSPENSPARQIHGYAMYALRPSQA